MKKDRFVAFFDAVMAIIMTIAVPEFAVPDGAHRGNLRHLWVQIAGLILGMLLYPPLVIISIVFAMVVLIAHHSITRKKKDRA